MAKLIKRKDGLKVFFHRHQGSSAFALGVFVGAGCYYEDKSNNGISHFIEHTVFKGTESRTAFDIANETDKCGVILNAFTSRDLTAFYTIGLAEYADKCADILSDILFRSTFTEENLEKEKGVVLEEIKMYGDDTEDVCLENLTLAHYGRKNVSFPILGPAENIKKFTRQDILDYMAKYYRADNACVAIVGDMTEEDALSLVDKYFLFPSGEGKTVLPKIRTAKPRSKFIKKVKPLEQSAVGISFPSYPRKHKDRYLPMIVSNILGGGMSSRLFQEVREKAGLVYEIYSSQSQYDDNSYFYVYFGTDPKQTVTAVKKVAVTLKEAKEKGFSQEEFEKAMAQVKTAMVFGGESAADLMRMGGRNGLKGVALTPEDILKEISSYTLDDVNACLRDTLEFSQASLSYVGKKPSRDLLEVFLEEVL